MQGMKLSMSTHLIPECQKGDIDELLVKGVPEVLHNVGHQHKAEHIAHNIGQGQQAKGKLE